MITTHASEPTTTNTQHLTPAQQQAILALVSGGTRKAAGEAAGVGESTVYRWLNEPRFAEELRDQRFAFYNEGLLHIQRNVVTAVDTLVDVMKNGQREHARVNAARVLLHHASRSIEIDDLAAEFGQLAEEVKDLHARVLQTAEPENTPPPDDSPASDGTQEDPVDPQPLSPATESSQNLSSVAAPTTAASPTGQPSGPPSPRGDHHRKARAAKTHRRP